MSPVARYETKKRNIWKYWNIYSRNQSYIQVCCINLQKLLFWGIWVINNSNVNFIKSNMPWIPVELYQFHTYLAYLIEFGGDLSIRLSINVSKIQDLRQLVDYLGVNDSTKNKNQEAMGVWWFLLWEVCQEHSEFWAFRVWKVKSGMRCCLLVNVIQNSICFYWILTYIEIQNIAKFWLVAWNSMCGELSNTWSLL